MHLLTGCRRCKMISQYFARTSAFVPSSCARSSHKIVFSMIFRTNHRAGRQSAAFSRVEYEIEFISLPRQCRPGRELQLVKEKEICIQNIYSDTHAFALESSCFLINWNCFFATSCSGLAERKGPRSRQQKKCTRVDLNATSRCRFISSFRARSANFAAWL